MFTRSLFNLRQYSLNKLSLLKSRIHLPEKWKGGRIEKWGVFLQTVLTDYKTVATDIIQDVQTRSYRAAVIASGLGVMFIAMETNPDYYSFRNDLVKSVTSLAVVGDPIRNPTSEQHIQYVTHCQNQGLLRRTNLIFFSLLWVADYTKDCDIYAARCKYLKPSYLTFYQRIIDIGVFNTWWNLRRKMVDYDVNPSEWE